MGAISPHRYVCPTCTCEDEVGTMRFVTAFPMTVTSISTGSGHWTLAEAWEIGAGAHVVRYDERNGKPLALDGRELGGNP